MPPIENDWAGADWGQNTIEESIYAGPLTYKHYDGKYKDTEIDIEIWPIVDRSTGEKSCITEVSFKVGSYDKAKKLRSGLMKKLENAGIMLHEDALKTGTVLDAYIGK